MILPNYPATTKWLTPDEQAYAQWRLLDDAGEEDKAGASSIKEGVKMAFRDPKLYLFTVLQNASILSQTFQYFFPTIVNTLGFGKVETLLLTVPVWIATFLASLVVTYTSGRFADRSIHIICLMMISVVGNIIVVSTLNTPARFFAVSHFNSTHHLSTHPLPILPTKIDARAVTSLMLRTQRRGPTTQVVWSTHV
jgi:hypothetical protein